MESKKGFLVFILVFLLCLFQLGSAYAEYAHKVNRDTYGALSKDGVEEMFKVISAEDLIAFNKLLTEGEIFPIKKGTRVFLEDVSFTQGYVRVKPEGRIKSIWMFTADLTPEGQAGDTKSQKSSPPVTHKIEGFVYDKDHPAIIIGEEIYALGDSVCGGKIINISSEKVTIQFQDREKTYKVGDVIQ